jgi:lipopolysaccharide export system ATP-binding protein
MTQPVRTLRAEGLKKGYRGREVVCGLELAIRSGEVLGLLGPNGAGKTTTFYMIVGLVHPDGGKVYLDDHDLSGAPMYERARKGIGYLPQETSIFRKLTVRDNILAVLEFHDDDRGRRENKADEVLAELGLTARANSFAYTLSGGEKRRCEIARCLALDPAFVLLDEPFAGIDPKAIADIQALIGQLRARGIGVIITDHNVRDTLKIVDRAAIIKDGKVFREGLPNDLATDPEVLEHYLGTAFRM